MQTVQFNIFRFTVLFTVTVEQPFVSELIDPIRWYANMLELFNLVCRSTKSSINRPLQRYMIDDLARLPSIFIYIQFYGSL